MPARMVQATILAGQSVSNSVDLSEGTAQFIQMPDGWDAALLFFQVSFDNLNFSDLVDHSNREITINVAPGTMIRPFMLPSQAGFLRLRSGSQFTPIAQEADRIFTISYIT